jgi:aromatic-L-amino-acid/L-tryptophan decarboxylase
MSTNTEAAPLELPPEALRKLGYRIVDALVDYQQALPQKKACEMLDWHATEEARNSGFPEDGVPADAALDYLLEEVFPPMMRPNHPRFFSFVPSPSNMVSALAESLMAGLNPFAGAWMEASGPAVLELATVNWLRQVCGYPEQAKGLFVSGGSAANLTALAVARRVHLNDETANSVIYYSDQTHSSVERALRILGFSSGQIRRIPSDENYRLSMGELVRAVRHDRLAGLSPFCVVANAGTTNTGAVDPLPELADFCGREYLWLHADGAYGAASALCERGRTLLHGLDRVDSLSIDPHKWLFQPFEIGCVIVREGNLLPETFRIFPEYLQDVHEQPGVNFCDYGIQLTRNFRAVKLWLSLQVFGVAAFRESMERGFALAEFAEEKLRGSACWEVIVPAHMAIVCFRHVRSGLDDAGLDAWNSRIAKAMFHDGSAAVTTTVLRGRKVLRFCTINPRTSEDDIARTIARLEELAAQID